MSRRRLTVVRLAVLLTAALLAACRQQERAPATELYTVRTLGLGYLQRNQLSEAESTFVRLTQLAPDDATGFADLGLTYIQAGRYADAEKQLERARELAPRNLDVGMLLARLYALTNRPADARATLEQLRRDTTPNARVLAALAELEPQSRVARLREALAVAPANVAVRLRLVDALARAGRADSAAQALEEVRRASPEPARETRAHLDSAIARLRAGQIAEARPALDRYLSLVETTTPYQAALDDVRWSEGPIPGRLVLDFAPKDFIAINSRRVGAPADTARYVDATSDVGIVAEAGGAGAPNAIAAVAAGDVRGGGVDDLLVSAWSAAQGRAVARLYRAQGGFVRDFTQASGIALPQGASFATFADHDNDGWLDLFAIGGSGDGRGHLFRNKGDLGSGPGQSGTFEEVTARAGIADVNGARRGVFVDLDHDGDLDLLLVGDAGRTVYRNNLDGTFTDATSALGLAGPGARDVAFADFDDDGRVDVAFVGASGVALYLNGGASRFADATQASGLTGAGAVVVAGDYDNDGAFDLLVAGEGEPSLWRNGGRGTFTRDTRSAAALRALRGATAAAFVDHDNDGWLDIVGGGASVTLLRNDRAGRFAERAAAIDAAARRAGASAIAVTDVDADGDEDLLVADRAGAPRLLRNAGGNANLGVRVSLAALRAGSGKNNAFGVGARMEVRAGELYQARVVTRTATHFGLGSHLKADVVRVEWPNGVPQTVFVPGTDADVVEREMLKGSCAFAYTWDGTRFRFVSDVMWRSALGMPMGLMSAGGGSAFAPAGASQEYIRIPGDALAPRNGRYVMQLTEELWETAYVDDVKLVAVDHPDSVDVFVDERFVPPGPVSLRLFQVARPQAPRSAVDGHGHDVLPALRARDDVYVSDFTPTDYQGVVAPHEIVLDLGPDAGKAGTFLFLRGWIYPTDASINVALAQRPSLSAAPPSVEVRDASGKWVTALPSIGFPSGKDKTIVVDLAGLFRTSDRHVRIRTSMAIYWDQAFVGANVAASPTKLTTLSPLAADLHFRGFSRTYRKGGRHGPFWFDYDSVTTTPPWRPIEGALTRFGDVLPLLERGEDMFVIMGPGDETTLQFDASSAASLPKGWKRDFLLYTDGWIKDSDLNTAHGTTVEPLPFHAIRSYPYAPGESYPSDSAHARYQREYNTRVVRRAPRVAGAR